MNEPHENLDPFADDAKRRPSRLRRPVARAARRHQRERCSTAGSGSAPVTMRPLRHNRPCPDAPRGPLR
jgi:hypothetical protein